MNDYDDFSDGGDDFDDDKPEDEEGDEDDDDEDEEGDDEDDEEEPPEDRIQSAPIMTIVIVPKEERRTSDKISKFEITRIIGEMEALIAKGNLLYVEPNYGSTREIAVAHVRMGRCPLVISREVRIDKKRSIIYVERWEVNELQRPSDIFDLLGV